MARNTATSQRITGTFASGLAYPSTYYCRVQAPDLTAIHCAFGLAAAASSDDAFLLYLRGDTGGDPAQLRIGGSGIARGVNSAASYTTGTWMDVCGRATTTTDYDIFLNAVKTDGSTAAGTPSGITTFVIGADVSSSVFGAFLNDDIACCAAWSEALTDDEITSMFRGFSPRRIRPASRVLYAPLIRTVQDIGKNGITLTDTGTTVAVHPRSYGY
jgi:hypothetical protein